MRNHAVFLAYILSLINKVGSFQSSRIFPATPRTYARHQLKAATTEASFTLPRFLSEEIEDCPYPSPLHTIHVRSILSDEEVSHCRELAIDYAEQTGCWNQPDQERHSTYSTCDFPIEENEELASYLNDIEFDERVFSQLQELYEIEDPGCLNYLDFFCAHYQANGDDNDPQQNNPTNTQTMDRLEAHRDGSLLSFTILINDPSEFEGGGTFFDGLRDVVDPHPTLAPGGIIRPERAGDVTFHSGKLLHGADVITKGKRTVLVGFIDVANWIQRPGVIPEACKDWGRMDVALFRHKRQLNRTKNHTKSGWLLNNARWLPQDSDCCLKGYVPAFDSVTRRADPGYQRQRKLETEDRLLRTILLPEEDQEQIFDLSDGDITVL